jgi:hypothetical protein
MCFLKCLSQGTGKIHTKSFNFGAYTVVPRQITPPLAFSYLLLVKVDIAVYQHLHMTSMIQTVSKYNL